MFEKVSVGDGDGLSIYRLGCLVARRNNRGFDRLGWKHELKIIYFFPRRCERCFLNLAGMLEAQCSLEIPARYIISLVFNSYSIHNSYRI